MCIERKKIWYGHHVFGEVLSEATVNVYVLEVFSVEKH